MKSYKEKYNEMYRNDPSVHVVEGKELKRLQNVLLEIYLDVQAVCEKRKLTCMLLGGSALGAVRHKGFIPWDDDLDIGMPRTDYEKFKEIFKSELGDKYVLNSPNYEGQPTNRFPKILKKGTKFVELGMDDNDNRACIKIDIFVIDNIPDNIVIRYLKGVCCTFMMFAGSHVYSYENRDKSNRLSKRELIGKLLSFVSAENWFDKFDKICRCSNENSVFLGIPSGRKHYFGEILHRTVYLPQVNGEFEGNKVYLPANPDQYLNNLYGNYMDIPPIEKREKHYIKSIEF